jgi:hypothetical protein
MRGMFNLADVLQSAVDALHQRQEGSFPFAVLVSISGSSRLVFLARVGAQGPTEANLLHPTPAGDLPG